MRYGAKEGGGTMKRFLMPVLLVMVFLWANPAEALWPWSRSEAKRDTTWSRPNQAMALQAAIQAMSGELIGHLNDPDPEFGDLGGGLIACSFVDLQQLTRSSSLGRYLAEQLKGEFQRRQYRVIDIRKSRSIIIAESRGEYGLSRDPNEVGTPVAADAMITGTYTVLAQQILVNASIIDNRNGVLRSSAMLALPRCELIEAMLADQATLPQKTASVLYLKRLELK